MVKDREGAKVSESAPAKSVPPTAGLRLGDLLVSRGIVTRAQVEQALELQAQFGGRLGTNLEEMGFVTGEQLAMCLSAQLGLPYADAEAVANVSRDVLERVPADVARRYRCVPLAWQHGVLALGVSDHTVTDERAALCAALGAELRLNMLTELNLNYALERYYGIRREVRGLRLVSVVGAYRWLSHASRVLSLCTSFDEIAGNLPRLVCDHFNVRAIHFLERTASGLVAKGAAAGATPEVPTDLAQRLMGADRPVAVGERVWCALRDGVTCRGILVLEGFAPAYGDVELLSSLLEAAANCLGQIEAKAALARGARLTQHLRRYVNDNVVDELSRDDDCVLYGRKHEIAVMFADIRGFTALSERLDPDLTVQVLNTYFAEMSSAIEGFGGTIDKFIGDGLMAFWGAPKSVEGYSTLAVRAAVAMQERMPRVNRKIRRLKVAIDQPLVVGVGIATGVALVGNIGTTRHMQYTAVGDVVNVASRLCSQAGAGEVLVCGATAAMLPNELPSEAMGPTKVRGRDWPVVVHRVRA